MIAHKLQSFVTKCIYIFNCLIMIIITRTATALAAACVTNINEVMKHMMCLHKLTQPSASFTLSSAASPNSFTLDSALAKAF